MSSIRNSEKQSLYFPQRITEAMGKILEYPITVVEAPMGYGKTTAVREHVMPMNVGLLWQNIYDHSKAAYWSGFCLLLGELDHDRARSLLQLGFPDDSVTIHAALRLIEKIALPKKTVIVIDDFHLVDTQEMASFITFVAIHKIENLHIVLISRFFEFINAGELSLKGYLLHVKKESFEFSQKEIMDYYRCCGIDITAGEADELYSLTEGWISALYLLQLTFKESGRLLTSINIYKLIEQAVFNPFSDTIKNFLLSMSIYNSFTQEQAAFMMPDACVEEMLAEVTGKNAFVKYDPIERSYHIHTIFKNFLDNRRKSMDQSFQLSLYKEAAKWYMQAGDYLLSMQYAYLGGEYNTLLQALEMDKGQSINGEHKELLIQYFSNCPMEYKRKHPYAMLIYARRMLLFNENTLFRESCKAFLLTHQRADNQDAAYQDTLLGEYELLMSFAEYNDLEKMSEYLKRADMLLESPSQILDNRSSWTFGSPSVLYLFYRKSGDLLNEVQMLREAMPYYNRIAGSHGKGVDEIMSAERFFHMGDFLNAEIAMHKAYQTVAETSDIMLCVIFLNIRLSFMKGDYTDILALFEKLRNNMYEKQWKMAIHTIDICEAYIFSCLHMHNKVAPWVQGGEFQNTRLLFPALAYLNIVYGKVLLENGEHIKLLGRADQFLRMARMYPNMLAQIYTHIYIAAASSQIFRADDAIAALTQALGIAAPDRIYMPFVENGDMIRPILEKLQSQNLYAGDIAEILALYKQYSKAVKSMAKGNAMQVKAMLTEREYEIARLAAHGFSNRKISKRLYISENTVKTHLKRIYEKLGIQSRLMLKQIVDK